MCIGFSWVTIECVFAEPCANNLSQQAFRKTFRRSGPHLSDASCAAVSSRSVMRRFGQTCLAEMCAKDFAECFAKGFISMNSHQLAVLNISIYFFFLPDKTYIGKKKTNIYIYIYICIGFSGVTVD